MKRIGYAVLMLVLFCAESQSTNILSQFKEAESMFNSRQQSLSIPMFEKLISTLEIEVQNQDRHKRERELIAKCYDFLGQALFNNNEQSKASAAFLKLIEWSPDYQMNEDLVSTKIVSLFKETKRDNLAMLTIKTMPTGAIVRLNERPLGSSNLENVSVIKGKHRLEITLQGHKPEIREIEVSAGVMQEISVLLAEDPIATKLAEIEASLKTAKESRDAIAGAIALRELSEFQVEQNELDQAVVSLEKAHKLLQGTGKLEDEAAILVNLGNLLEQQGAAARARDTWEEAVSILRKTQNSELLAQALQSLGRISYLANDLTSAKSYDEEAAALLQKLGDAESMDQSTTRLQSISAQNKSRGGELLREAYALMGAGNYADAEKKYQEALTIAREARDKSSQANALLNLGFLFSSTGRESQAVPFWQEALTLARENGDRSREALSLYNLAIAAYNRGDRRKADELYEESASIYRKIGEKPRKKLW